MLPSILSLSVTVYRTQNAVPNSRSEKVNHLLGVHDTEKGPKRSSCQKNGYWSILHFGLGSFTRLLTYSNLQRKFGL